MHLSQRFLNSLLFYTEFCSPYNLLVTGVFKVREYTNLLNVLKIGTKTCAFIAINGHNLCTLYKSWMNIIIYNIIGYRVIFLLN